MIWVALFIALIIVSVTVGMFVCWKIKYKHLYDHFTDYLLEYWKIYLTLITSFTFVMLVYISPTLYKMGKCSVQGSIMHTTTQYSWVMEECQAQNATGSFVDINRVRGLPSDHTNQDGSSH